MQVNLEQIVQAENPIRTVWSEEEMKQLVDSIKQWGVIQAVKLRPLDDGFYEIVDGARRVEAARRAGLETIEATIEGMDDQTALIQSLIANVQREDMLPLDKARGLKTIHTVTGFSYREMARRGIMPRSTIRFYVSLLDEPEEIQSMVEGGQSLTTTLDHLDRIRAVGLDDDDKIAILKKASSEQINQSNIRKVAEAVKVADELGDEDAKQALLEKEYSPTYHNPERVRDHLQSAKEDGRKSASYTTKPPELPEVDEWEVLFEAADVMDGINDLINRVPDFEKVAEIGKLSPEGQRFLSHRIGKLLHLLVDFRSKIDNGEYDNA